MALSRRTLIVRAVQVGIALLIIAAALRTLEGQWTEVRRVAADVRVDWGTLSGASAIVIGSYLLLVATWRHVVNSMGGRLGYADAAYIWFVSALARYLGALWQVVALSALARRLGAPPLASAGAAVVMTIVNVITGFGVVLATGAAASGVFGPRSQLVVALGIASLVAAPLVAPRLGRLASRATGREVALPQLTPAAVWAAAAGSIVTWVTYGVAFHLLTVSVLGEAPGHWLSYVSVYTTAYLMGLLGLVPAGVAVAEAAMVGAFAALNVLPPAEAALVAVVSRLWRTALEIAPGALMLLVRGRPRGEAGGDAGRAG